MRVTVQYSAQARQAAGRSYEEIVLPDNATLTALLQHLAQSHGDLMRRLLLDADNNPHPSVLIFVNEEQVTWSAPPVLHDGDDIILLSPVSGG